MADEPEENGKKKAITAAASWVTKHIGVPVGIATLLITSGVNWLEAKNTEFGEAKTAIVEMRLEIKVLKEQKATDRAQWRAIQRFSDKVEPLAVDVKAHSILIDKILGDTIRVRGERPKEVTIGDKIGNFLGTKKPEVVIRRAAPKRKLSVKQYQQHHENAYNQEQQMEK